MHWTVYKFGGASVKDAYAIRNLIEIVRKSKHDRLVVVISAMGKVTNALESIWEAWMLGQHKQCESRFNELKNYHLNIVKDLFEDQWETFELHEINDLLNELEALLKTKPLVNAYQAYDQITPYGELLSTTIIHRYALTQQLYSSWVDARELIVTDDNYREAKVDWDQTRHRVIGKMDYLPEGFDKLVFAQGFIAGGSKQQTTLGREGSDYSAAIFAHCLDASQLTIWKDVPGVLNADPKYFNETALLKKISFKEAIELSYFGATIIHPKTIKPLQNLNIPLYVKSFLNPDDSGTVIQESKQQDQLIPSFIFKVNQRLISIQPKDFSFIVEENLVDIFEQFTTHRVKIHLMENSALSFTVCVDESELLIPLIASLKKRFLVRYNENLELVTIRHYTQMIIDKVGW